MKSEIIDFINALMEASPEVVEEKMTESVKEFLSYLETKSEDNYELTDNGKIILNYMQKSDILMLKSKDIADGLGISSRGVSGSLRKLVTDGFCEKIGKNPVIYSLTEKGKTFIIKD